MTAQGQDASDLAMKMAEVIKERQKGTAIEEAVSKIFAPVPAPTPAPAPQFAPGGTSPAPVEQPVPSAPAAPSGAPQEQQQPIDLASILTQLQG
jgi:hypothetical protein